MALDRFSWLAFWLLLLRRSGGKSGQLTFALSQPQSGPSLSTTRLRRASRLALRAACIVAGAYLGLGSLIGDWAAHLGNPHLARLAFPYARNLR